MVVASSVRRAAIDFSFYQQYKPVEPRGNFPNVFHGLRHFFASSQSTPYLEMTARRYLGLTSSQNIRVKPEIALSLLQEGRFQYIFEGMIGIEQPDVGALPFCLVVSKRRDSVAATRHEYMSLKRYHALMSDLLIEPFVAQHLPLPANGWTLFPLSDRENAEEGALWRYALPPTFSEPLFFYSSRLAKDFIELNYGRRQLKGFYLNNVLLSDAQKTFTTDEQHKIIVDIVAILMRFYEESRGRVIQELSINSGDLILKRSPAGEAFNPSYRLITVRNTIPLSPRSFSKYLHDFQIDPASSFPIDIMGPAEILDGQLLYWQQRGASRDEALDRYHEFDERTNHGPLAHAAVRKALGKVERRPSEIQLPLTHAQVITEPGAMRTLFPDLRL